YSPELTFNVVILGVGFLFIFTAFTTCGNVEQTVVKSLGNESFSGSGYYSLGIIYGIFSFSNLLAPTVVAVIGAKHSMFLSGLLYSGYIAVFILPFTWSFYLTSVLIGIGAAMLWTAQGQFLVENSEASTINRNTGMFWALLQCRYQTPLFFLRWCNSRFNAGQAVYGSRKNVFLSLLVASVLGTLSFLVLRQSLSEEEMLSEEEGQSLLSTRMRSNIYFLNPSVLYALASLGLELSFYTAKGLIGISGIVIGVGEIVGGGFFGLLCKNNRFRRTSVVFLGMVVHFVAFYLIFLNIPADAPVVFKTTTQMSPYLSPSVSIALLCSFLLGLGDSCFNTQLYSILGRVYAEQSTPAFAIFKFIQSVFAAVAFFYSGHLLLMWQLLVMVVLGFSGTLCFFMVERMQNFTADLQEY
uniref:Major facilitator superfamily domain containing 11 n=1 Tax=Periophthalmus magnuspinnatus TaxID=409849 RepID=A0A3B3ZLL4_9GOBI